MRTRRNLKIIAFSGLIAALASCSAAPPVRVTVPAYDLLILDGRIADGSGAPAYAGDIAIVGDEIVQLYIRDLVGEVTRPVKELKGFKKISLQPGESQTIIFEIPVQRLGFHGLDMQYKVEPGDFKVWVGPNAAEGLAGEFEIE